MEIDAWRGAREKSMHVPCFSSVVPLTDDISRALISSSLVGELGTVCVVALAVDGARKKVRALSFYIYFFNKG